MSDTIDQVLELFKDTGPEFAGGFSNHGPMGAEAMISLGRGQEALSWSERYRKRLRERPPATAAVTADNWREALGEHARVSDWATYFQRELGDATWQEVLNRWVPRLAPGLMAASTHGVIRTGHAVRSLSHEVNALRVNELADGLAYWAAFYLPLPTAVGGTLEHKHPRDAIHLVDAVPPESRGKVRLITDGMAYLSGSFATVIDLVDAGGDPSAFLSEVTEAFAGVYLTNTRDIGSAITFIHTVTAPSCVRLLTPFLDRPALTAALRHAWQSSAALYAVYGGNSTPPDCQAPQQGEDDLIDRAVAAADEHAVKFTEACLREYRLNPKPVYLAAACDASNRLSRDRDKTTFC